MKRSLLIPYFNLVNKLYLDNVVFKISIKPFDNHLTVIFGFKGAFSLFIGFLELFFQVFIFL